MTTTVASTADRVLSDEEMMETLYALSVAKELVLHEESGRMAVVLPDRKVYEVPGDALDKLMVDRKWIVVRDETKTVTLTQDAEYWLDRWLARRDAKSRAPKRPRRNWRR